MSESLQIFVQSANRKSSIYYPMYILYYIQINFCFNRFKLTSPSLSKMPIIYWLCFIIIVFRFDSAVRFRIDLCARGIQVQLCFGIESDAITFTVLFISAQSMWCTIPWALLYDNADA